MRGEQLAFLTELSIERLQSPVIADLLNLAKEEKLAPWDQANLREMNRAYIQVCSVPVQLLADCTRIENQCTAVWRQARAESNWSMLEPVLKQLVRIVREIAQCKGAHLGISPYDALLDEYDPGARVAQIDPQFSVLEQALPSLIQKIQISQGEKPTLSADLEIRHQEEIAKELMKALGFDFQRGRLDVSTHPFCGGQYPDIRITSRYDRNNPLSGLQGVIHETGHALYEQHLPSDWRDQPVGRAAGMSVHESQSLFMEKQVGGHSAYIRYLHKILQASGKLDSAVWSFDGLKRWIRFVEPSLIRVEADEVTYPLHVILRYRIEKALIGNDIEVHHIPDLWNTLMQKLLGITPPNHRLGCLQDIHWPSGNFGYFPSYTRGAIIAAQLAHFLQDQFGKLGQEDFSSIVSRLQLTIHQWGSFFSNVDDLIQQATGEPIGAQYFLNHIQNRYFES